MKLDPNPKENVSLKIATITFVIHFSHQKLKQEKYLLSLKYMVIKFITHNVNLQKQFINNIIISKLTSRNYFL